jgi:hypothetical protein
LLYKLLDLVPVLPVLPPKFVPVRVTELGKKLTFRVCAQVKLYDSNFTTCLRITNRSTLVCTVTPALPGYQHFDILTCSLLHIQHSTTHCFSNVWGFDFDKSENPENPTPPNSRLHVLYYCRHVYTTTVQKTTRTYRQPPAASTTLYN